MPEKHAANTSRLLPRIAGLLLALAVLLSLDPTAGDAGKPSVLHQLLLPGLLAVAVWLILRSVLAIATAAMLLAAVHTEFAGPHWIDAIAYPTICVLSGVVVLTIGGKRFRRRIVQTRQERRALKEQRKQQKAAAQTKRC